VIIIAHRWFFRQLFEWFWSQKRNFPEDCSAAFTASTGSMLFAFYPDLDNIGSSANPWIDRNGIRGAVGHTGPTFHAGVEINYVSLLLLNFKN
jgi:hypothetical protein